MTDSAIKYVGVDGCKGGWIGVGLSDGGCWDVSVCKEFADLVAHFGDACIILVDMPIGLHKTGAMEFRCCDEEARCHLEKRKGSVFQVPSQKFVTKVMKNPSWSQTNANNWLIANSEGSKINKIGAQGFGIIRKIGELRDFLNNNRDADLPKIMEAHPEICFWALNGRQPMSAHKSEAFGLAERFEIVQCSLHESINVFDIFKKVRPRETKNRVGPDDVLDALALAVTAKLGLENGDRFLTLPENSKTGCRGEMVYALSSDEGSPC